MSETKENLIDKLASRMTKLMFASEEKSEAKEVKLETAKLKDGTEVEIEGDDIFVVVKQEGEEVEKIPAPVGEHELENGDIVVVEQEGKIAEVKSGEAKEEVETKENKKDDSMDLALEVETLKKEMADLRKMVEAKSEEKEEMSKEEPKEEVKEDLSKAKPKDEPKVELSKEEEPQKVTHSPEKQVKPKMNVKLKNHGGTKSNVYNKLFS